MMHNKMNRALSSVGVGILCGMVAACAGGDTPARTGELVQFVGDFYGTGAQTGSAASGGSGGGGNSGSDSGGSSGDGGSASGDGGSASGDGGSASGDGGSATGNGGDGGGEPVDCDGLMILQSNCNGGTCHDTGSSYTDFVADAAAWVNEPTNSPGCSSDGVVFDTADPSQSLVILKLGSSPPCGSPMPFGTQGNVLSDADIACVEEFISGL